MTNLGCRHLRLTLGRPGGGSGDWRQRSRSGVEEAFFGGYPAFAFLHTAGSRTGHHLQNAQDEDEELKELTASGKCERAFTRAGTAAPEVLFGEQAQGSAIHLKASLLRPAQWVFLLRPVEPESNILFVPQRRVDSCRSFKVTHRIALNRGPWGYFPMKQRLTQSSR